MSNTPSNTDNNAGRRRAKQRAAGPAARPRRLWRWTLPAAAAALVAGAAGAAIAARQAHRAPSYVATVNGARISRELFSARLSDLTNRMAVADVMVEDDLALQYARNHGAYPTDAEIEAALHEQESAPNFEHGLALSGQSRDDLRNAALIRLARVSSVIHGVSATEADERKFYDANADPNNPRAQFYTPETAHVSVVITRTEPEARRAVQELQQGRSFAEVARAYSMDLSRTDGGALPPIARGRTRFAKIPGLEPAIFAMRQGETLGPRQFGGAWWVLRLMEKTPATTRPFDAVRPDCVLGARLAKMTPAQIAKIEADFEDFRAKSRIQAFYPNYRALAARQ